MIKIFEGLKMTCENLITSPTSMCSSLLALKILEKSEHSIEPVYYFTVTSFWSDAQVFLYFPPYIKLTIIITFAVSIWWGQEIPRQRYCFWVCLWRYFQKRLALEFVNWGKHVVFFHVGGHHSLLWGLEQNQRRRVDEFNLCLTCLSTGLEKYHGFVEHHG
jgi:hypothetical protein